MSSETKVYGDGLSQPVRSVWTFIRATKIPVDEVAISIMAGDHKKPDYLSKFPIHQMPAMEDGDLKTTESAAILTYLSNKHEVAEHWYSRLDLKARARVDAVMHWFHGSVRKGVTSLVIEKVLFEPFGLTSNEVCAQKYLDTTKKALNTLEDIFLANNKFVAGDEISVADLMVASEIEQLCIMKKEPTGTCMAELLEPYPKIRAWMKTVAESCAPHYDATHEGIRVFAATL